MKISKAIVAAVGAAAAIGAAVYAKKKLEETQTPLRKKSLTVWKNGEVTHKEIIRKPISEEEQTDAINSRIDEAVRRYKPMSERGNGETETETEPEIAPVNFTFTQSEDDSNTGVSFERVFNHFNRLESSVGNEGEDAGESDKKAEDTAEEALSAVTAVEENFDEQAEMPKQMMLEKGIMTSAPIANAVQELAEMPSVIQDNEEIEDVNMPVDESIFDLYASEPVEEAVKAFEEIAKQEETADSEAVIDDEQNDTATEEAVSEPVEDAVKAFEEIAEQEETADSEAESEQNDIATEEPVSEPVEEAVKAFEEIAQQEETADSETEIEDEQNDTATEEAVSEPVEEAVKAFEEIAEQEETADSEEESLEEQFHTIMAEETASEPVSSIRTAESVEDALKEFGDFIGISETADSTGSTGSTGSSEDISDDDLEQTSGIFEESTLSDELSETPDEPIDADEKPRTMDFFDLPDEAYTPAQVTEEKHDENVAEVEDLFGNLLMDDEPEVKKTFNDPSEVFSLFDTADGGQDDFDKYSDEKIEEESEKKKTSDTRKYIAQDIADNIASFAQLLEPLNAIKENKIRSKSGILFDWEMRIQALIGDLPIKTYWRNNFRNYEIWSDEKCMEKAGELLSMLELVGIVRDKAKEVVIDKDTLDFYSAQSEHLNNDFHIGETVVVTRPCWKINGRPARKGEIAKKAPFAEFSRKKVSPLETMLRENSCSDGDVNIPVTEDNFCTYDREIPYVKRAIAEGFCKCAVRRMEDGGALAFFYEVIAEGENVHYSPCTLRFEVNIDKNANVVGRFRSEKV